MSSDEAVVIDTPAGIMRFHMLAQYHALHLETLGIGHSSGRSVAKHVRETYKLQCGRSKQAVLDAFKVYLEEKGVLEK